MKRYPHLLFLMALAVIPAGCKDYLEAKPTKSLVVPQTISDYQSLMDQNETMNRSTTWAGEASADNYFLPEAGYNAMQDYFRNLYIWSAPAFAGSGANDWSQTYKAIYYCNIVLDGLKNVTVNPGEEQSFSNLKGMALFFRAKYFLDAISVWTKPYDPATAATDPGIPLRMDPDFNEPTTRASLQESYDAAISGLKEALPLLPEEPVHVMRPSKAAAYAFLSRACLWMQDYEQAGKYADSCLQLKNALLDFNTLNASANYPIARFNPEVIMHFRASASFVNRMRIDTTLYDSYEPGDLRKTVFFKSNSDGYSFKGSYDNTIYIFTGPATDEMYLTRAECYARAGNTAAAMNDLDTLLKKRYTPEAYHLLTASNAEEALNKVLSERRKELLMRTIRWTDLKRLNREPERAVTLQREVNGETYMLSPGSGRYALPIPEKIVALTGIEQNEAE